MPAPTTVADLGEDRLLAEIFPVLPPGTHTLLGPGDDAAVVAAPDARVVVSTDLLVEGRHFRLDWSTGADVGRRAAVQNLADVAAMGARPVSLVVGLVIPPTTAVAWVLDLARGLAAACAPYGVGVVGGDLSGGEHVVVAVTVHGDLESREPVLRSGARPGDVVAHAGRLGTGASGYALLAGGHVTPSGLATAPEGLAEPVRRHLRPASPLEAGPAAADGGATALMDVSDGLLRDAGRLARGSGVVLDLRADALRADVDALRDAADVTGQDPWTWVLGGGEDHGFLATFPAGTRLPDGFRSIGQVRSGSGAGSASAAGPASPGALVDGRPWTGEAGWDHFRR